MKVLLVAGFGVLAAPPGLSNYEGYDDKSSYNLIENVALDDSVKRVFVSPDATKASLVLECADGQKLYVNGHREENGEAVTIKRNKSIHHQVVEVECVDTRMDDSILSNRQRYEFLLVSDWELDDIMVPRVSIPDLSANCEVISKATGKPIDTSVPFPTSDVKMIECPDPKMESKSISITSLNEPSIKYTIHNSDRSFELRLLNKRLTVPFPYSSSLYLSVEAGKEKITWPISFGGSLLHSVLNVLGYFVAGLLGLLMLSLIFVVGGCSISGHGVPIGATEVAATLTLLVQFFTFANVFRGSNRMESFVTPLKALTLFLPAPLQRSSGDVDTSPLRGVNTHFARAFGVRLWGDSIAGDVTDLRNAWGCVVWSLLIVAVLMMVHAVVRFQIDSRRYTIPHRFAWGGWENRAVNWLLFPCCAAATLCALSPHSTAALAIGGYGVLVLVGIWFSICFLNVVASIKGDDVVWVWNSSFRESPVTDGSHESSETGYWADVINDQVKTQPLARSQCKQMFPFQWVSTFGDIEPTAISVANDYRHIDAKSALRDAHHVRYNLAKQPAIVALKRAREPSHIFRGHRLVAGLLRTKWLDLLLTYNAVTQFHHDDKGSVDIPLVVKTYQLSGPITDGSLAFFFDGVRVPFIRLAESMYKILLGGLVAGVMLYADYRVAAYSIIAAMSIVFTVYIVAVTPYTRRVENALVTVVTAVIGSSAAAFAWAAHSGSLDAADGFLWALVASCCALGGYALMVSFAVVSSVVCPPLYESRFLERLSNCTAVFSNPTGSDQFEVSAYSKYAAKDLLSRATKGRVEVTRHAHSEDLTVFFDHVHLRNACLTGVLPIP